MKPVVRKEMKQTLRAIPAEDARRKSHAACRLLAAQEEFRRARTAMIYLHIPHELNVGPLALAAWQDDKTVLVPKVDYEQRHMIAVEIRSLDTDLEPGRFGILEPMAWEPWPVEDIDLVVAPGLAFGREGSRLGRGGGFYDRFLSQPDMHAVTCGIAFAEQLLAELPTHAHDVPLDMLVTDDEVLRFNRKR